MSYSERVIIDVVYKGGKYGVPTERVVEALYAHREDGGPVSAVQCVHVFISRLNRRLLAHGYRIVNDQRSTGIHGRYRIMASL